MGWQAARAVEVAEPPKAWMEVWCSDSVEEVVAISAEGEMAMPLAAATGVMVLSGVSRGVREVDRVGVAGKAGATDLLRVGLPGPASRAMRVNQHLSQLPGQ